MAKGTPLVIAFGGSILAPETPDETFLADVAKHLAAWAELGPLAVVVGGGHPARVAIERAREQGHSERQLDELGIEATRRNADVLRVRLGVAGVPTPPVPHDTEAAAALLDKGTVVMGGTTPGHSTDFVATELAWRIGGRLMIATSVDGVYTSDPRQDEDATRLEAVRLEELADIVGTAWGQAGAAGVIDGPACALMVEHGLQACVMLGTDLENLDAAVRGNAFHGTRIGGSA